MDNEKFQGFIVDQFAKMFNEFKDLKTDMSGLKTEMSSLKASQVRMENKFDDQIKSLYDFRSRQEEINQDVISRLR